MATVYASNSGYIYKYAAGTWAAIRGATTGAAYNAPSSGRNYYAMSVYHTGGRGGNVYRVQRSYLYFDTSSITGTLSEATLKVYGYSQTSADIIVVKSDAYGGDGGTALASGDFDNLDFSTAYSSQVSTWSTSGYNDIALNATALTDIKDDDAFIVCIIEHDHDYSDSAPSSSTFRSGMYYDNYTGTSRDPYIDYTLSPTGYSHSVTGVDGAGSAHTFLGKVNGVAMANIEKVIGV